MNNSSMMKKYIKIALEAIFFVAVVCVTVKIVFNGTSLDEIFDSFADLSGGYLWLAILSALGYIFMEGIMINGMMENRNLRRAVSYSFVGFFYSGITPSASGGQPMQLVYMTKDGEKLSNSCAILTVVAMLNKAVLAVSGILIIIFRGDLLEKYFEDYDVLFGTGTLILTLFSILLSFFVFKPIWIENICVAISTFFHKLLHLKKMEKHNQKITEFFDGYREVGTTVKKEYKRVISMIVMSVLQRFFLVLITYIIYKGFGLKGTSMFDIMTVQLAIMVAVDFVPLPGTQGISELVYKSVFAYIFSENYLISSMCASRIICFYFLLITGCVVSVCKGMRQSERSLRRKAGSEKN